LAKPKPNQEKFLLQPNFSHPIFYAFVTIPHQDCTKPSLHLFTNFATKGKKANPLDMAKPNPTKINFFLQPNFTHRIFDAFVTVPHQDCTKAITSLIHQFCYQGKKSQSTELG